MEASGGTSEGTYIGWAAGALVIVAIIVVAAVIWFHYHPF